MRESRAVRGGNLFDKFRARNPAVRLIVDNYKQQLWDLIRDLHVRTILEVGCGEGHIATFLGAVTGSSIHAVDIDAGVILEARTRCPAATFAVADGLFLPYRSKSFDLVAACEVLEHVERPDDFLVEMQRVSRRYCLLSVPREPMWRTLNVLRGAYVTALGNTPGHIQHWSAQAFLRLLRRHFGVLEVRHPLPWTLALCAVPGGQTPAGPAATR